MTNEKNGENAGNVSASVPVPAKLSNIYLSIQEPRRKKISIKKKGIRG